MSSVSASSIFEARVREDSEAPTKAADPLSLLRTDMVNSVPTDSGEPTSRKMSNPDPETLVTTEAQNEQHDVAETPSAIPQFDLLLGGRSTPAVTTPSNQASQRKIEANRRNAQQSTGPKTPAGKARSSWNSLKHGLLSRRLLVTAKQDKRKYSRLLSSLRGDLVPVGTLEEVLVEKIAYEYWRLGLAASQELSLSGGLVFTKKFPDFELRYETTINRQL
jgi:hypothetical protein